MAEEMNVASTAPKKRGRPKKVVEPEVEVTSTTSTTTSSKKAAAPINKGSWSKPKQNFPMQYMHVEVLWTEKALATLPNNKELLAEYIASNAPDAASKEEEIAAVGAEGVFSKALNVYPKGKFLFEEGAERFWDPKEPGVQIPDGCNEVDNVPYYYNYQLRGFFKDSCGLLNRADELDADGNKIGNASSSLKAYRKVIDGGIFVFPRRIGITIPDTYLDDDGETVLSSYDKNGNLRILQRALRISGPTGERAAIAASEMIPPGSSIKFTIGYTNPKFKPAIVEWLNYASVHGISGWRNSGMGACIWREIKPDYTPYDDEDTEE